VPPVDVALATAAGLARVRGTDRSHGTFHLDDVSPAELERRRRAVVDLPWTLLDEVHGTTVRVVTSPGEHDRREGDALVTQRAGLVLGVWVGDCAPVALVAGDGTLGAVHAGWRGLRDGVLSAAADAMRALGASAITAVLGACIGPCCYEFGEEDLADLTTRFGPSVRARTTAGAPSLDVPAAVRAALAPIPVRQLGSCAACDPRYWSHRARGDRGRHALAVWREAA
jgi:copper oxidase (laccase) domain-containing protein